MTTILICNVGNSDIQIAPDRLPDTLQSYARDKQPIPERLRAQELLDHYSDYLAQIDLALIRKAIRHVEDQTETLPDQVILIASDQPAPPQSSARFYNMDTIITAEVIKQVLVDRYHLPEASVAIWRIIDAESQHNPADYDGVMRSMEHQIAELRAQAPDARCYLEVTGGTPAMTTSLLIAGTKVLGKQAIPIYITQNSEMAYSLNTGRKLLQHTIQGIILSDLAIYSYGSAGKTYEQHRDLFRDYQKESVQQLTIALLRYAHQRLNLDFQSCRRALSGMDGADGGRYRTQISQLYQEVTQVSAPWLLREVYYGAKIKYERGEYADFTGRIFRFHEGCLRYLVEQWGAQFVDEQGKEFRSDWVQSEPVLLKKLTDKSGQPRLDVNRVTLSTTASFLAKQRGDPTAQEVCKRLTRIDALANLRNRTQIAHGYTGLSRQVLADYFALKQNEIDAGKHAPAEEADKIVIMLGEIYTHAMGNALVSNPFDKINNLLRQML